MVIVSPLMRLASIYDPFLKGGWGDYMTSYLRKD